ncbi:RING finger protein 150 [Acipenser ruthenus]|uniref:RING finger protein 150 n=1 Tax=Acipenser ruthenus TaxID=7906 RepID=A0A444V253_ACIRT|nr:RING finger protein 150 [Acipenser ruthenus]
MFLCDSRTYPGTGDIVVIMIPEPKGRELMLLLEKNVTVMMYITIGTRNLQKYVSRTSVVFVSISFIVLMIISLAWLVFYYIQRFRYANARDRNQRRLGDAAKKAISKLQVRTIRKGDKPNADCTDDIPPDYEGSIGGPSANQITGASELTVNESSVVLDPAIRAVGLPQVFQESEPNPQAGEIIINTSSDLEPAVSSDSDTSLIMGVEVGLSDVEISTDQDYEVKS